MGSSAEGLIRPWSSGYPEPMPRLRIAALVGIASVLLAAPAAAGAWSRTARLGALPINGDAKHRIAGTITWQMPSDWIRPVTEVDIPGVRFWPSNPAAGCHALSVFSFQGSYTKAAAATRVRQVVPIRRGGFLLGAGTRNGGVWRLAQNIRFGEGMPVIPGAHYVDGVSLVRVGANRWLELSFRAYTDGTCSSAEVRSSNVVSGAEAFLRDAELGLRVIGRWPAGVTR